MIRLQKTTRAQDQDGNTTATAIWQVPVDDEDLFVRHLIGGYVWQSGFLQYFVPAIHPRYDELFALSYSSEYLDESVADSDRPSDDRIAIVTVQYGRLPQEEEEEEEEDDPAKDLIEYSLKIGGEEIALKNQKLKWLTGPDAGKELSLEEDVGVAKQVPLMEIKITRFDVPNLRIKETSEYVGFINSTPFKINNGETLDSETVIFEGADLSPIRITTHGVKQVDITYSFTYRANGFTKHLNMNDGDFYLVGHGDTSNKTYKTKDLNVLR